jgi:hypothetical protein
MMIEQDELLEVTELSLDADDRLIRIGDLLGVEDDFIL